MSALDRLLRRFRKDTDADPAAAAEREVDGALERWVVFAEDAYARSGPSGRLVVSLLGESLVEDRPSPWFGYEPLHAPLAGLLAALDEDPDGLTDLLAVEAGLAGRRLGALSESTRARWRELVLSALANAHAAELPERDETHREAERVWREAASAVQDWRAVQLDPDGALRQLRWYPGCPTRTRIGYSDPLNLAMVQRAVEEHRYTPEEWRALEAAAELLDRPVDPLTWRLSSLARAAEQDPQTPGAPA